MDTLGVTFVEWKHMSKSSSTWQNRSKLPTHMVFKVESAESVRFDVQLVYSMKVFFFLKKKNYEGFYF